MRLVKLDTSLRPKVADKRNSHRINLETQFHFSDIISKRKENAAEVSFVVDRGGVRNTLTADACSKHHKLPIRYAVTLPVQKVADRRKETQNENETSRSRSVQHAKPSGKRPENVPRKRHFLQTQLSGGSAKFKAHSVKRYHAEDDPRFSAMKPGVISESLRDALGISHHQLPLYIYNMRQLGYPPGHLENARRQHSGILVFTRDRCEVTPHGEILEEGEVNEESEKVVYDIDKLIDYPGFNIDPPDGTLEECERLDLPFMQAADRKEAMMRVLSAAPERESTDAEKNLDESHVKESENFPTVHSDSKAAQRSELYPNEKMAVWLSEMGLSAADGWLVIDALPEVDDNDCECSTCPYPATEGNSSDSLHLFDKSQTPPSQKTLPLATNLSVSPEQSLATGQTSCQVLPRFSRESTDALETVSDSDFIATALPASDDFSPKNSSVYGDSLNISSGTPVIADSTFWSEGLPDAARFSLGMSDPLPYENLPNATGAFQRLKVVLTAARCKSKRLF